MMKRLLIILLLLGCSVAMADLSVTLNIDPEVAIDFVTVGDVDNPADAPDRLDDRLKAIGYVYDIMNVGNDLRTTSPVYVFNKAAYSSALGNVIPFGTTRDLDRTN